VARVSFHPIATTSRLPAVCAAVYVSGTLGTDADCGTAALKLHKRYRAVLGGGAAAAAAACVVALATCRYPLGPAALVASTRYEYDVDAVSPLSL